ncbi:hypothetical protein Lal_00045580 [Lupinus albus]|nr:hypothetical protein Lal_00045580 [Lupinus albus]
MAELDFVSKYYICILWWIQQPEMEEPHSTRCTEDFGKSMFLSFLCFIDIDVIFLYGSLFLLGADLNIMLLFNQSLAYERHLKKVTTA